MTLNRQIYNNRNEIYVLGKDVAIYNILDASHMLTQILLICIYKYTLLTNDPFARGIKFTERSVERECLEKFAMH